MQKYYSLRLVLPLIILLLIIGTIGLIQIVNYHYSDIGLGQMARTLMKKASQNAVNQAENLLEDAVAAVRLQSSLLAEETEADFDATFSTISLGMMRFYPQFRTVYYGDSKGRHWSSLQEKGNTISTRIITPSANGQKIRWIRRDTHDQVINGTDGPNVPYDPRQRPWYQGVLQAKAMHWTDIYAWQDAGEEGQWQLGITLAQPVGDPANPKGVSGIDITLSGLAQYLAKVELGQRGVLFILDAQNRLVLPLSNIAQFGVEQEGAKESLEAQQGMHKPQVNAALMAAISRIDQIEDHRFFSFVFHDETWLGRMETLKQPQGLGWRFGVLVPEKDFTEPVRQALRWSLVGALVLTFLAVIVGLFVARSVTRPLALLSDQALKLSRLEFLNTNLEASRFGEIRQLGSSFKRMTSGLRSFEKYVPTDLVKLLLLENREASLAAERKELTLFFADIQGFTRLCEQLDQDVLLRLLSQYFGTMTEVIRDGHQGVIDKFIGDAVMAFWNAPQDQPNHASLACKAALDCQKKLVALRSYLQREGMPEIRARIGINTGDVLVGNMGAVDRINYTAIGDPVNLASRLESLCKDYQVEILISEYTRRAAGPGFTARLLDAVVVRGKSQPVFVYELLPEAQELDAETLAFLTSYQQGITAFANSNWEQALKAFETAKEELRHKQEDPATQVFIARCRRKLANPKREFAVPFARWQQEILPGTAKAAPEAKSWNLMGLDR